MSKKHNRKIKTATKNKISRNEDQKLHAGYGTVSVSEETEAKNRQEKVESFCRILHIVVLELILLILLILDIVFYIKWRLNVH